MKIAFIAVLIFIVAAILATPSIERNAAERIGRGIPADSVNVDLWDIHVDWYGMDWNGIDAESASLTVPLSAALKHFATGKPVSAGKITATNALLDMDDEAMRSLKSILVLGGIRKKSIHVKTGVVNGYRTETGFHVIASDLDTDIGRFRFQGNIENKRFASGELVITDASKSFRALFINMAQLTNGKPRLTETGISITW